MDSLASVGWAGVNALLIWAIVQLCRRLFSRDTTAQTALATLVLFWAAVTLACFVLSVLHSISGVGIVIAGVVLTFVTLSLLRYTIVSRTRREKEAAKGDRRAGVPNPATPRASALSWGHWLAAVGWLAVLSFWVARVSLNGLGLFPTDFDSLMYHIPLVDHWLQAGTLYAPDCPLWYNASTNELFGLWLVAPFSGDFLISLNNVPACVLLALGTLELTRGLGVRPPFDHLLALAVTATQVFYKQLIDNENDIAVTGLFFACIVYGLRYLHSQRRADLALAAVCFGLLAGIKYYAAGYAVVAWTGLSLCAWLHNGRRDALRVALAGVVGGLVFCGYWYGRNLWLTGTPFYPLGLTRSSNSLPDFYPNSWRTTFLGSGRPEVFPLALAAVQKMAGPCQGLALLAVPLTLGWLVGTGLLLRAHPEGGLAGARRWLLAFLTAGAGAVLVVTPWAIETDPGTLNQLHWGYLPVRFGQCFLSLAVVALGVVLTDLSRVLHHRLAVWTATAAKRTSDNLTAGRRLLAHTARVLPAVLFAGLLIWQMSSLVQDPFFSPRSTYRLDLLLLTFNIAAVCLLVYYLMNLAESPFLRWGSRLLLLALVGIGLAWGGEALASHWHTNFAPHYDKLFATRLFSQLEQRNAATTRLCAMDYRYYPFFGSRRQYRLCRPMKAFSYPWLVEYLRDQQVNAVVCVIYDAHTYGRYREVSLWLRDHPEVFVSEQEDSRFVWADVDREQLAGASQP